MTAPHPHTPDGLLVPEPAVRTGALVGWPPAWTTELEALSLDITENDHRWNR